MNEVLEFSSSPPALESVAPLTQSFSRVMRSAMRMKQKFGAANGDPDWAAHQLVAVIVNSGPLRASQLAEQVQADPSTISRHVAALIKDGLIQRQLDPDDGRACLLAVTEKGTQFWADSVKLRTKAFQLVLCDWSDEECRQVAVLLERLAVGMDACDPRALAELARREVQQVTDEKHRELGSDAGAAAGLIEEKQ